jgi:hypothetical protein
MLANRFTSFPKNPVLRRRFGDIEIERKELALAIRLPGRAVLTEEDCRPTM